MKQLWDQFASPAGRNRLANRDFLGFWITMTAISGVYFGLSLATVMIACVKGSQAWFLVGLLNAALGLWNARSSARNLRLEAGRAKQ